MSAQPAEAKYRFGPLERKGVIAGLTGGQVLCIGTGLVAAVLALRSAPTVVGLVLGAGSLLVGTAAAFVPVAGRTAEEWAPVLVRWWAGRVSGTRRWRGGDAVAGRPAPSPPPALRGARFLVHDSAEARRLLGVVHDRAGGVYCAAVAVAGGGFALTDGQEKSRRLAAWGSVLAGLAREGSVVHRIQWVERSLPGDSADLQSALTERLVPDAPPEAAGSYRDLVAGAGPVTPSHQTLMVVAVAPGRCRRQVRAAGGGEAGALTLLGREVAVLEASLRGAEIDVSGPLGPGAMVTAVAAGFHGGAGQWRTAWPVAMETRWDAVRADGQWHAVYWVAEWPRSEVGPDFLIPLLLLAPGVRAVSVTMEPVSPRRATREVEAARTSGAADEELRRRGGFLATARRTRQAEGMARREAEMADGHSDYRFSGYVDVVAASAPALDRSCAEVEHAAAQSRLELRRLYGQQDQALTYVLPVARGLR
ncbi:MAG TPA: SCO6880 family protein [Acidimicrobiales bacterium]|nr:SCO6880 family protein [Acidimicrobiales bacterium]